jgi:shikimate dehydrogenase
MKHVYGLVGRSLAHSWSRDFFERKFTELGLKDHTYVNIELPEIVGFREAVKQIEGLRGLNVTVPYKRAVMAFMDALSPEAEAVGAVNCIDIRNGRMTGHNTDVFGFTQSIKPFLDNTHGRALILGTGGAAQAVAYALKQFSIDVWFVSRQRTGAENTLVYEEVNDRVMQAFRLVVNATPVGMYPHIENCPPLPYELFSAEHLAYDLIYNPAKTLFLSRAEAHGATVVNGLSMLHWQAERSWQIWTKDN